MRSNRRGRRPGRHDQVIEQLNLHGGGGQAHRAGQASVRVASGGISLGAVVYEFFGGQGAEAQGSNQSSGFG
jgi:hypothetical protein